jgi:hypothetical protein
VYKNFSVVAILFSQNIYEDHLSIPIQQITHATYGFLPKRSP